MVASRNVTQRKEHMLPLGKYSFGMGDRFAHQARAQLRACIKASEQGADVDAEAAAAKAVNINFVHLPFNVASPAPDLVDRFVAEVSKPANQPAFIHCAAGGRAAALWMIKRVQVDHWDQARASEEATALGLTERLKTFAVNYIDTHQH